MSDFHVDQRVAVFDPEQERYVLGWVTAVSDWRVLVSLDDRMVPVLVDPANSLAIIPADTFPHIDEISHHLNDLFTQLGPPPVWEGVQS